MGLFIAVAEVHSADILLCIEKLDVELIFH